MLKGYITESIVLDSTFLHLILIHVEWNVVSKYVTPSYNMQLAVGTSEQILHFYL